MGHHKHSDATRPKAQPNVTGDQADVDVQIHPPAAGSYITCINGCSSNDGADAAASQLQAELYAHLIFIAAGEAGTTATADHTNHSMRGWIMESTQVLPRLTWAAMDRYSPQPRHTTHLRGFHGHVYVREDEAMILRPRTVIAQEFELMRECHA